VVTPAAKRKAACVMVSDFRRSQTRSCALLGLRRSTFRYRSRCAPDTELREKLRGLAQSRPRFGYRRLGIFLRREGHQINHKRLFRIYQTEGLALPRKRQKRRLWQRPKPLLPATVPGQRWSIDFVSDRIEGGRRFRALTIVDDCSRESPAILVDTSIGGVRVVRLMEELGETTGLPATIVLDNGPEFTSRAFLTWAEKRGIELRFIQPGKPTQNAYVESFNGKLRDECLEVHWFTSLVDAREVIETWRRDYNEVRPHSSLDDRTPAEYATLARSAAA
jgi:putative transposase